MKTLNEFIDEQMKNPEFKKEWNPSLNLLKRLAEGMGMVLKIEFVPKAKSK